jgi:FkbM family methyltransferase
MKFYDDFVSFRLLTQPYIKNWGTVLLFRMGFASEIKLKLRDGQIYPLRRVGYILYLGGLVFVSEDKEHFKDTLHLILDNFVAGQYSALPVKDRYVVDIGANIGDTAIRFAVLGAKHVYAYEPFPYIYEIAKWNIIQNRFERKIKLFNEAVSDKKSIIKIDEKFRSYGNTALQENSKGKKVSVVTLKEIVKRHELGNSSLKLDAEGYEYRIILSSSKATLRKFKYMVLEYHNYSDELVKKLESVGFKVSVTPSQDIYHRATLGKQGLLFAERVG